MELTVSYGENAHSAMFDFASTIAPAARMRATIVASCMGIQPFSASEPAVVCRSCVSKLSFTIIGTQWSGPIESFLREAAVERVGDGERGVGSA